MATGRPLHAFLAVFILTMSAVPLPARAQTGAPPSAPPASGVAAPMSAETPAAPAAPTPAAPASTSAPDASEVQAPSESGAVGAADAADSTLPHDLSPVGMFLAADVVVKTVMIALALASVATWSILLFKLFELGAAKARLRRAVHHLSNAQGLRDAADGDVIRSRPAGAMVMAASRELEACEPILDLVPGAGVKERVASHLGRIETGAGKAIAGGTGILATVGSISPFVGLFGTVWGIMNAFIGISQAQTTNLAIVAPGIAEALLATAIGLVAAIPAVVVYNYFARAIAGYRLILGDASAAVDRLVSRDLDVRLARRLQRPAGDTIRPGDAPMARAR